MDWFLTNILDLTTPPPEGWLEKQRYFDENRWKYFFFNFWHFSNIMNASIIMGVEEVILTTWHLSELNVIQSMFFLVHGMSLRNMNRLINEERVQIIEFLYEIVILLYQPIGLYDLKPLDFFLWGSEINRGHAKNSQNFDTFWRSRGGYLHDVVFRA